MERRVFIAILLCFVVLYGYQAFIGTPTPTPATTPTGTGPVAGAAAVAASLAPEVAATAAIAPDQTLLGDSVERDLRVETRDVVALFTNRGGRLKSWKLKNYLDRSGDPLDLIAVDLAATQPLPFSLRAADDQTTTALNSALYTVRGAPEGAGPVTAPTTLTFEYRSSTGLTSLKEFRIDPSTFTLGFRHAVSSGGQIIVPAVVWGPGLGDTDSQTGRYAVKPEAIHSIAGKISRIASSGILKQPSYQHDFDYAGIDDHYFIAVALKPGAATVTYTPLAIPALVGTKDAARELMGYSITPARTDQPLTFYIGPKNFDALATVDLNLTKAINFGIFSVLVVPLLRSLEWIHGFVGNYGWAITILTILINLVLFPLNHKSVVSMRKMQEIQPETKAIQERYAKLKTTDPARQKMNSELMALYRERGVNPASGCIPILLTLPVFLAFYAMLSTAIELRGAPFVGWIHDLSMPDPYYVLPILVGISQIVTQWMTPQAGVDPTQQKMMMIMPVVLMFVFFSTPAGALIYWFVGGVWRIGQMQLTNYIIGPTKVRAVSSAGERRVKRVGQGKTDAAAREE